MPSPGRSAGTESEIPWIPRWSNVVELGWGVGQWLGSQILGGVDIVNIKIYQFSQTLDFAALLVETLEGIEGGDLSPRAQCGDSN